MNDKEIIEAYRITIVSDPCPECEPYDGEIVSLHKNFYGASEFADGDPPLHPNCKCAVAPVVKDIKSKLIDGSKNNGK